MTDLSLAPADPREQPQRLHTASTLPPSEAYARGMSTVSPHGLHHVTAIATDPQANVDFYTRALGLRLVKQTVNFDAPDTYHLYYGDEQGTPVQPADLLPVAGRAAGSSRARG